MLKRQTVVALGTTLGLSAMVVWVGCSGGGASAGTNETAGVYHNDAARDPAAAPAPAPHRLPFELGDGGLEDENGLSTNELPRVRGHGGSRATPWPTPTTSSYSYGPTTYWPTYYPTTPTPTSATTTLTAPTGGGGLVGPSGPGGSTWPTGPTGPTGPTTSGPSGPTSYPTGPTAPTAPAPAEQPRWLGGNVLLDPADDGAAARPAWEPAPGEELWVIERPVIHAAPVHHQPWDDPGQGQLFGQLSDGNLVPAPLQHTDVQARIQGHVGAVQVTQTYANPWSTKIEAVYVFPLPTTAAVSEFVMTIGERKIRGIVRERAEAEQIYAEARAAGHVASLMTQERPNVFRQKVANIEPGRQIDIAITYFETLDYQDGWYQWVFPMVVGPRFDPPGHRDPSPGVTYATSAHERPGNDIALSVAVDAGVAIEELACPTHGVDATQPAAHRAEVRLHRLDRVPNKDFVLRWRVAGDRLKTTLTTQPDGQGGGWFTLTLYPPRVVTAQARRPVELVFLLDCSGSMSGVPIHKAKQAISRALRWLRPDDTFQVIRFSNNASALGAAPLAATPRNVQHGLAYLASLNGEGGTMMIEGIKCALDYPPDPYRQRVVSFMTDGFIGNEDEILTAVHYRLRGARLFSFGVGASPNRHLLEGLARMGRGAVAWVGLDDQTGGEAVDRFYERLAAPALTDVAIDWRGWQVHGVYPRRLPDLYVGRPITVVGCYRGEPPGAIAVTGRTATADLALDVVPDVTSHAGIAKVWARHKIADLSWRMNREPHQRPALQALITDTALRHGILSAWTAFLAVDSSRVTAGRYGTTVEQPVPLPQGMDRAPGGAAGDD